jgi:hypothetical protein
MRLPTVAALATPKKLRRLRELERLNLKFTENTLDRNELKIRKNQLVDGCGEVVFPSAAK